MLLSSAQAPVFPHQPVLNIPGKDFRHIFQILRKNTDFTICIPAASILITHWKNTGHSGAGTSTSTVIWTHRSPYMKIYINWSETKIILSLQPMWITVSRKPVLIKKGYFTHREITGCSNAASRAAMKLLITKSRLEK